MKNAILFTLLLLSVNSSFSQQTQPKPPLTKEDYLQKSKKQKTTAWLMLVGGTVVSFIGLSQINLAGSVNEINNTPGTILFITGAAAALSSIHFFSVAKKNKQKAMSVSFKNQPLPKLPKNNYRIKTIPSLNFSISL